MKTKTLSIILTIVMLLTVLPVNIWAEDNNTVPENTETQTEVIIDQQSNDETEETEISGEITVTQTDTEEKTSDGSQENIIENVPDVTLSSSSCGENLIWSYDKNVLTISGTGEMDNYDNSPAPWSSYAVSIKKIIIEEGVTSIGKQAFKNCYNLTYVYIPDTMKTIHEKAFMECISLNNIYIPESVDILGDYLFYTTVYDYYVNIYMPVQNRKYSWNQYCFNAWDGLTYKNYNFTREHYEYWWAFEKL